MIALPVSPTAEPSSAAERQYEFEDAPPDQELEDLGRLATLVCGVPMAVITLIDVPHQWFCSQLHAEETQTGSNVVFTPYVVLGPDLFVTLEAVPSGSPPVEPQVVAGRRYLLRNDMPLVPANGHVLGTLSTLGQAPHTMTGEHRDALAILGRQAAAHFQLRHTYGELRRVEALRDCLAQMIVHDLRQPLQSLIGGLQTLQYLGDLNAEQCEFLRMSVEGGEILMAMVNDLLDVSRLEKGVLELDYSRLSLRDLIDGALAQLGQSAAKQGLTLTALVAPDLPAICGDREKLGRTLVNLIGNALKFTPRGGTISITACRGDVADAVCFSVADTGEGIPAEAFERIFEEFGQVAARKGGHRMSTGLGLTFCKMVVEAHGGSIRVESQLGKGAVFHIQLPTDPLPAPG